MNKKIMLTLIAVIFVGLSAMAEKNAWERKKYVNISYSTQTLQNVDEDLSWKSEFGVALAKGTTYYLHKKPLAGMIKFGIDWTQFELNYAKLKPDFTIKEIIADSSDDSGSGSIYDDFFGDIEGGIEDEADELINKDFGQHQFEASMHVGPSITINPVDVLNVNAYFRYAPSLSAILYKDMEGNNQASFAFANFFVTGGAVSWKVISLGAEYRWGTAKYNVMSFDSENLVGSEGEDVVKKVKNKMNTHGMRVYVSLRF